MFTYFWLTTFAIIGLVFLSLAVLLMAEECKARRALSFSSIAIVLLFLASGAVFLIPFGYFAVNPPITINEVSNLARICPDAQEKIQSRTEILKYREATTIYNQCLSNQELAEEVTLEKQKKAAMKK